jgi:exodeoxyribonuclease V
MSLTIDQQTVLEQLVSRLQFNKIENWNRQYISPFFIDKVGGYAGTGKTFLISILRKEIKNIAGQVRVAFCTFTGKAASVLRRKLQEQDSVFKDDFIGTIHSLMYRPKMKWSESLNKFVIVGWESKYYGNFSDDYDLIIVDEASMVGNQIWTDLRGLEAPIIAFGDHGQLPPVEESQGYKPAFTPNFLLQTIHRQALDSPIIQLSIDIRQNGYIPRNTIYSEKVFKIPYYMSKCQEIIDSADFIKDDVITLCGFNVARARLNKMIRTRYGHDSIEPMLSEKVICLKNNHSTKIMNGQIGKVLWVMPVDKDLFKMTVDIDDDIVECLTSYHTFGEVKYDAMNYGYDRNDKIYKKQIKTAENLGFDQIDYFDYGYATSVHKSQGSEWKKVILIEQRAKFWDDDFYKKWLYTGVTRARESLMVVSDFGY